MGKLPSRVSARYCEADTGPLRQRLDDPALNVLTREKQAAIPTCCLSMTTSVLPVRYRNARGTGDSYTCAAP